MTAGTRSVMSVDPDVLTAIKNLGANPGDFASMGEKILAALSTHWRKYKRPPTSTEMVRATGFSRRTLSRHYAQLKVDGKVHELRHGAYVPLVQQ